MSQPRVIDFFCGAGGFSEGFRQQGFDIVMGIDRWKPAMDTFNYNFGLEGKVRNMLDFDNIEAINELPDTEVILGSPPCVSFSSSNRSGTADKSMGITLIETFLRIIAVKKHQPGSVLKAWFMENVEKSRDHLRGQYTFGQLGLGEWASQRGLHPRKIAIRLSGNSELLNSADFGGAQLRKRLISGEIINAGKFIPPIKTHGSVENLKPYKTLGDVRARIPSPLGYQPEVLLQDPNYPSLRIPEQDLSDHFYDTGLYKTHWTKSWEQKMDHPYMGKMSFPEREDKPSRTITATKISSSREAIVFKSEYQRTGDGEFRSPTVREAATIMGFPISYQFVGMESAKWRMVGNAVCPCVSGALAQVLRAEQLMRKLSSPILGHYCCLKVPNLNNPLPLVFDNPPKRLKGGRFRKHAFKNGNITVTLSNYDILSGGTVGTKWVTSVQFGNGKGFPSLTFQDHYYRSMETVLSQLSTGPRFIEIINNGFSEKIASGPELQAMYDEQVNGQEFLGPSALIEHVAEIIDGLGVGEQVETDAPSIFPHKERVPQRQLLALYAINKICSVANH
jgi:DNA (cytosine-5)-methyltransferase 1